jgi:hypothetical protein
MEQMNFHKKKLYALIIAGVALVALLLPWLTVDLLGASQSWNGLRKWGILSLFGVLGVGLLAFPGNKAEDYTSDFKKYTMIAFGAIALGALLFYLRKNATSGGLFAEVFKTGIGLWICLAAGVAGLLLIYGLIKVPEKKATTTTAP